MASAWSAEGGGPTHHQTGAHAVFGRHCHVRSAPAPARCLDIVWFDMLGVEGGASAAIGTLYPVRLRGLGLGGGLYVDLAGGGGGTGTMTISSGDAPAHVIPTADLPDVATGLYDARVHGTVAGADVEARARRRIYLTTDGDLSIEDRAEASVGLSAARTRIALRGFAARTAWWTSKDDPGHAAVTGGGEVALARRAAGLDWDASVGVARSFYATLDGAAAGAPELGARGMLEVRRVLGHGR